MTRDGGRAWITRDALVTGGALASATALAWWWLATSDMAMDGTSMAGMDMPGMGAMPWTPTYALSVFVMWTIMMVAMMLPPAAPMILLYARVAQGRPTKGLFSPTVAFVGAYIAVWASFSALAAATQWWLSTIGLVSDAMRFSERAPGGILLIAAGLYQLTPLKRLCLANCRTPLTFLTLHWRPGLQGALSMGLRHGAYCVGCCWFVMALLFVGGVMNLAWVVAIAAFVLAEKVLPFGEGVGTTAGVLAIVTGVYFLAGAPLLP